MARFTFGFALLVFANPTAAGTIHCSWESVVSSATLSHPADFSTYSLTQARFAHDDAFRWSADNPDFTASACFRAANQVRFEPASGLFGCLLPPDTASLFARTSTTDNKHFLDKTDLGLPSLEHPAPDDAAAVEAQPVGPSTPSEASSNALLTAVLFGLVGIAVWADA